MDDDVQIRTDKDFDLAAWLRLYHACGWNRDWTERNAKVMRDHAYLIVTAWKGNEIIGTLTVLSDGLNYATIDDMVVLPEWRRRGIASDIVRRAIEQLTFIDSGLIKLHAVPGVEPFYERLGFEATRETVMSLGRPARD